MNLITNHNAQTLLSVIAKLDLPLIDMVETHYIYRVDTDWKFAELCNDSQTAVVETLADLDASLQDEAIHYLAVPAQSIGLTALKSVLSRYPNGKVVLLQA